MKQEIFSQRLEFDFLRSLLLSDKSGPVANREFFETDDADLIYELIKGTFAGEQPDEPDAPDYVDLVEIFGFGALEHAIS